MTKIQDLPELILIVLTAIYMTIHTFKALSILRKISYCKTRIEDAIRVGDLETKKKDTDIMFLHKANLEKEALKVSLSFIILIFEITLYI